VSAIPERHRADEVSHLDALYDVRDLGVKRMLAAHPDLIPTLIDVAGAVPRYFGLDVRVALETVADPEDESGSPELYAVISTSMSPMQAFDRLNAFDADWWLERARRTNSLLTVTLD
jgi:hypothetical protein